MKKEEYEFVFVIEGFVSDECFSICAFFDEEKANDFVN